MSPDGTSVYVTNTDDNNISQYDVDPATGTLQLKAPATVAAGKFPVAIAVRPPVNQQPTCVHVGATPDLIWPASPGTMVTVTLAGATDADGDILRFHIDGVSQDEPVRGLGDPLFPDARLTSAGADSDQVLLRRQRSPFGNGRVYRIAYTVSDGLGGTCSGTAGVGGTTTARVSVPRKKESPAIDDGDVASWNSFTGDSLQGSLP